jgi:transcriptional regulator with XRE-family HTH domain
MKQTNFDRYLKEQLADPSVARRFERAGEAWDVALQLAALRRQAGLSQKELARRVKTSQQQICRLESPDYEGHSLSMLRRVARELQARVRVVIEPEEVVATNRVAEAHPFLQTKRLSGKAIIKRESDPLHALVADLVALQSRARKLGVFPGDRELLECPKCGLMEDVACGGLLFTCRPRSLNEDTGLRFRDLGKGRYRCPSCNAIVREPNPDTLPSGDPKSMKRPGSRTAK